MPATPTSIAGTLEFKTFVGLSDPARPDYGTWLQNMFEHYIQSAASFPGVTSAATIPGETTIGAHSVHYLLPGNDLYILLATDALPHALAAGGNVYAKATLQYEPQVQAAIEASSGNLLPGDLIDMALKATGGSYPLAVLTLNNLLKQVTKTGRGAIADADSYYKQNKRLYDSKLPALLDQLRAQNKIVSKLQNLRKEPNGPQSQDKMGPWYHAYTILSMGALVGAGDAKVIVAAEHGAKALHFFQGEGGSNREKFNLDTCWSIVAGQSAIQHLDRAWLPSFVPSPMSACYYLAQ